MKNCIRIQPINTRNQSRDKVKKIAAGTIVSEINVDVDIGTLWHQEASKNRLIFSVTHRKRAEFVRPWTDSSLFPGLPR